MEFEDYSIEELACDESFINYILKKNEQHVRFWTDWINQHPHKLHDINAAKELVTLFSLRLPEDEYIVEKEKVLQAIGQKKIIRALTSERSVFWNRARKVAAILIGGLVVGMAVRYAVLTEKPEQQLVRVSEEMIKENPPGQKSTVFLSDGSKVILNAASSIRYDKFFSNGKREIYLLGEAFFEVKRDGTRPFIVTSGNVSTTALGTSFNVKAFPGDRDIEVSLTEGKVKVNDPSEEVMLMPGQQATYSNHARHTTISLFDAKKVLSWKDRTLYFEDNTFDEVKNMLERWYGVKIVVKGATAEQNEKHYRGEYKNQSLETVLKAMSFSKHFHYNIQDSVVTIDFRSGLN